MRVRHWNNAQHLLEDASMKKQMRDAAREFATAHRGVVGKTMATIEEKLKTVSHEFPRIKNQVAVKLLIRFYS